MSDRTKSLNEIQTFGCRLNAFESEIIRNHLSHSSKRRRIIFNTCAVTAEAERQARQAIRKAKRDHPEAEIIVTGCAVQIDPNRYKVMPEVDRVIGNEEKLRANVWTENPSASTLVNDIMKVNQTAPQLIQGFDQRARAFVQVQQGCNHRCTFCIIPFGRGNSRSVSFNEIVDQSRILVKNGYHELVLTGINITSYGLDLPINSNLGMLVRDLLKNLPELRRLRLSSIDPSDLDDDLLDLIKNEPRLMPHLHLSIQAGNDVILKRMKRRHLREDVVQLAKLLRELRPDIVLGADLIAGFPTETETMFHQTLSLIEEVGFIYLHVFPYSPRQGTPAARMPQLTNDVRKTRAKQLREAGKKLLLQYTNNQVGKINRALIEQNSWGRTEQFTPICVEGGKAPGSIVKVVIKNASNGNLYGVPVAMET